MNNHPFLRNYSSRLLYAGVWLLITVVQALVLSAVSALPLEYVLADSVVFNAILALCLLPLWYPVYHNPWRSRPWYFNFMYLLVLAALVLLTWLVAGFLVMYLLASGYTAYLSFLSHSLWWRILEGSLLYIVIVLVYYLYIYIDKLNEKANHEIYLTKLVKDGELNLLKSQINPHFLFNSLNSVNSLIIVNAAQAQTMLVALSDYLRYMVLSTNREDACLQDEVENVERYLAIEKVRFGTKLVYDITIDPAALSLKIPSMLLQPLFENAVKHGVYESLQTVHIDVAISKSDTFLTIAISNDYDAGNEGQKKGSGIGLQNIRERLRLSYGALASLQTKLENDKFTAVLQIPL